MLSLPAKLVTAPPISSIQTIIKDFTLDRQQAASWLAAILLNVIITKNFVI